MAILFKKSCLAKTKRYDVTPNKTVHPKSVGSYDRLARKINNVFYCRWSFLALFYQAELNGFLLSIRFGQSGPTQGKKIVRLELLHMASDHSLSPTVCVAKQPAQTGVCNVNGHVSPNSRSENRNFVPQAIELDIDDIPVNSGNRSVAEPVQKFHPAGLIQCNWWQENRMFL
jgi:hypothetical protein